MGAIVGTTPGDPVTSGNTPGDPGSGGGTVGAMAGGGASSAYVSKAGIRLPAQNPNVFNYLLKLNIKRLETNEKKATVTIEEIDEPTTS
jgi:hypothetical protein